MFDDLETLTRRALVDQSLEKQNQLMRLTLPQAQTYFRNNLQQRGTNVEANDNDPLGDGDQSKVTPENAPFYEDMFNAGGDLGHHSDTQLVHISLFAKTCVFGVADQQALELASNGWTEGPPPAALLQLLETRETSLRLSPLLLIASMGKNVVQPGIERRQVDAAKLLLQYGARPDARDVMGNTVCHYGLGSMASDMTIKVANMCIEAHASSHFFGKQVELHGLKSTELNGTIGWCRGYHVDMGRREIYLPDRQENVCVIPKHLKLLNGDHDPNIAATKLCDIPDRMNGVCLYEVICSDRVDVARVLLKEHQADVDVKNCYGDSPRSFSLNNAMLLRVAAMINDEVSARERQAESTNLRTCSNCGSVGEHSKRKLQSCSKCSTVQYCSKECQIQHWKEGGHKKVCKSLAAETSFALVLDRPKEALDQVSLNGKQHTIIPFRGKKRGKQIDTKSPLSGYPKPSHVKVGEKFCIKVQVGGPTMPLNIYDKSRKCTFTVSQGDRGFKELVKAAHDEPTWQGKKVFIQASIDEAGNCTVYPGQSSIKDW